MGWRASKGGSLIVLIGLDLGTSGARVLAVDESGQVLPDARAEYPLDTPSQRSAGWSALRHKIALRSQAKTVNPHRNIRPST